MFASLARCTGVGSAGSDVKPTTTDGRSFQAQCNEVEDLVETSKVVLHDVRPIASD